MSNLAMPDVVTRAPPVENIPGLTGVRAYAAVWVMLLHLRAGVALKGHVEFGPFLPLVQHGYWAVDVFFVLSGFILSLIYASRFSSGIDARSYWSYLSARFARIYPLHLFALGVLAVYYFGRLALLGTPLTQGFSVRYLLVNISLLHGWGFVSRLNWNYPSWSISTEWFAYLVLLPVLAWGLSRWSARAVTAFALLLWTALYAAFTFGMHDASIGEIAMVWPLPRIAAEFALGHALFRLWPLLKPGPRLADALTLGGLGGIVMLCYLPPVAQWLLGPAVCLLVFGLTRAGPVGRAMFASRFAVYWGERSYSIYMLHAVVQVYCNLLIQGLGISDFSAGAAWLVMLLQAGIAVTASHFAYEWVELPMRQRLRSLLEWRRRAEPGRAEIPRTQGPAA